MAIGLSLEDRDPRSYSSTGSSSRRSNGRDRSASLRSPPLPAPEIRELPLNTSRAFGDSNRKRGSDADNSTATSSSPRHSPGGTNGGSSIGFDMDEVNAKLRLGPMTSMTPPTVSPTPSISSSSGSPFIRSRSSIDSLQYHPLVARPPPKHYPGDEETVSETEDDSKQDWLEAGFSQRESNTNQTEEEVTGRNEEAHKKEAELKAEGAGIKRGEEEPNRKEGERLAKEKQGERPRKEEPIAQEKADRSEDKQLEKAAEERREETVGLKEEREEAKQKRREAIPRQRDGNERGGRKEEAEQKRREEERLRAEQLEADRLEALKLEEEWRQEDIRREEARRAQNAETNLREVQRKDEATPGESRVSEARFVEEQRKYEAQRQRKKGPDDLRRRTQSSASYVSTSSTMPPLSEPPTKSGAARIPVSSQWASSSASTRSASTANSQGPIRVRAPTISTPVGRSSSGSWPVNRAPTSGTSPYRPTPMSAEEWEKHQQEHARKQQEQFRREQEREKRERLTMAPRNPNEKIVALFAEHDRQWARLKTLDDLGWDHFPWPMFKKPTEPEELTSVAIGAYVLSPYYPIDKSKTVRDRVKDHTKRWDLDGFETKLLRKVRKEEREKVREGARSVVLTLNEMLPHSNILGFYGKMGLVGEETWSEPKGKEDELKWMEHELRWMEHELKWKGEELKWKEDKLEKREAELDRRDAEMKAREERLRQEEADRQVREEQERLMKEKWEEEERLIRKSIFGGVRDRGGTLV